MPRVFTVSALLTRARQRSEQENSDFVSDAELKGILSTGYGELYSMLVESGMRYFESTQTITADGSSSYALPSDHLSTIGVDREVTSGGRRYALEEAMVQERNQYSGQTSATHAHTWALVGSNVVLSPAPSSGTYYHVYVPQPTDLTSADDSDQVDVVTPDGEAFLEAYLKVEILDKEESEIAGSLAKMHRARERIQWWATQRALVNSRRVIASGYDPESDDGAGDWEFWWR